MKDKKQEAGKNEKYIKNNQPEYKPLGRSAWGGTDVVAAVAVGMAMTTV